MQEVSQDIIKKCIKRKRKAQYVFYKCYFPYLYAIGYRYAQNRETTLEMVNLGFAKIMLNLHKYDSKQPLKTWMKTILVNVIIDEFRKTKRYKENIEVVESENLVYLNTSAESQFGDNLIELVQEKLKTISPMSRDVFNLYAIDGYKHKEIAEMLNISEGTSHWHYSIAKKELRQYIKGDLKLTM